MAEAILAGLLHGGQFTASDIRKDIKVVRLQKGMKPKALLGDLTLPRFYRHLQKGENGEIGGAHASKHSTSVYRGI